MNGIWVTCDFKYVLKLPIRYFHISCTNTSPTPLHHRARLSILTRRISDILLS